MLIPSVYCASTTVAPETATASLSGHVPVSSVIMLLFISVSSLLYEIKWNLWFVSLPCGALNVGACSKVLEIRFVMLKKATATLEVGAAVAQPVEDWAEKQGVVSSRPSADREMSREDKDGKSHPHTHAAGTGSTAPKGTKQPRRQWQDCGLKALYCSSRLHTKKVACQNLLSKRDRATHCFLSTL